MESNRDFRIRSKPRLILNKSFAMFNNLNVGDKGQLVIKGVIDSERIDEQPDGTELLIKKIHVISTEPINADNLQTRV